jgi:rhamnose transport system permease protein
VAAERPRFERLRPLARWETGLVVVALAVVLLGVSTSPEFLTSRNFFYMSLNVGEVAIMALPMTLIIVAGEIDLSVASTLGMASALLGLLWSDGWPMPAILIVVLLVGALAGLLNALLITRLGLPSLAVTIGTLTLYRGIALILLGPNTVSNFPTAYTNIGIEPFPGTDIPYSIVVFLALAIVFGVILHATPVGRSLFAIGSNQEAALYSGIRVKRMKTLLYVASGVICSFAGILYTFRLSTSIADNGTGLELNVVAVVLFAGVSIFGGKGSIIGVVLAVFTFAAIQNALLLINFNESAAGIVTGALLLVSVLLPTAFARFSHIRKGPNGTVRVQSEDRSGTATPIHGDEQRPPGLEPATARESTRWRSATEPRTAQGGGR